MDSSNTTGDGGNNEVGNTGMDSATLAGVVSTVITFVALIVSSIQLLYQYYTNVSLNALGARNCNERVMGPWAGFTRRRWRWLELRFEIIFESPIIFVASASNRRGPVQNRDIWYMDGSDQSYLETRTPLPSEPNESAAGLLPRTTAVRHGVNVEATWVSLLRTLQSMERDSAVWQKITGNPGVIDEKLPPFINRTLAVAVQAQTLSWDFVPNFKKPFATTTVCHMVELAAMLGIYWTMWNPAADRYRGEGNGFILLGSFNAEQGVVFQLIKHGKTVFGENRVIPNNDVKRLCFGFAPTLYSSLGPSNQRILPKAEVLGGYGRPTEPILPLLKLGSRQEITETMIDIGCPAQVAEYFLNEDAKVSHLFPVVFDVLGMLGRMVSVEGYCFRMLPNPTVFRWDQKLFDTKRLLCEFGMHFAFMLAADFAPPAEPPSPLSAIADALARLDPYLHDPRVRDYSPGLLNGLREAVGDMDTYLTTPIGRWTPPSEMLVLETVGHHVAGVVADLRARPSRLLDSFPLGWVAAGVKERNYVAFLFERSRYAATHEYFGLEDLQRRKMRRAPPLSPAGVPGDEEEEESESEGKEPWRSDARLRDVTWCLLAFRMLCWLQLHDFHRDDIMIPRSASFGSRMPVYII
ncbi:hypothetical protein AAE478_010615 [Parahypoxylon ruwenzoriense]